MNPETRELIERALASYPRPLPFGAQSKIASELGVSRQRVGQLVTELGVTVASRPLKEPKACEVCGKAISAASKTGICFDCRWVMVPCENDGVLVRRRRAEIEWRKGRGTTVPGGQQAYYTGRVFCNRKCFGMWAGKQNKKES